MFIAFMHSQKAISNGYPRRCFAYFWNLGRKFLLRQIIFVRWGFGVCLSCSTHFQSSILGGVFTFYDFESDSNCWQKIGARINRSLLFFSSLSSASVLFRCRTWAWKKLSLLRTAPRVITSTEVLDWWTLFQSVDRLCATCLRWKQKLQNDKDPGRNSIRTASAQNWNPTYKRRVLSFTARRLEFGGESTGADDIVAQFVLSKVLLRTAYLWLILDSCRSYMHLGTLCSCTLLR